MSTTDLKLEKTGSLPKPGPIGRLARFVFAALILHYTYGLYIAHDSLFAENGHIRNLLWNGIVPSLFLVSYIINIGYSRNWKKKPAIFSGILLLVAAGANYLVFGTFEGLYLAYTIAIWEFYLSLHLGLAFLLAGIIATPGCEMRAFHHLYSIISGKPTHEHICPVGPLNGIDRWEAARSSDK